jgi:hypothetical protein
MLQFLGVLTRGAGTAPKEDATSVTGFRKFQGKHRFLEAVLILHGRTAGRTSRRQTAEISTLGPMPPNWWGSIPEKRDPRYNTVENQNSLSDPQLGRRLDCPPTGFSLSYPSDP